MATTAQHQCPLDGDDDGDCWPEQELCRLTYGVRPLRHSNVWFLSSEFVLNTPKRAEPY